MTSRDALLDSVRRTQKRALWLGLTRCACAGLTSLCAAPLVSVLILPWVGEMARPWVVAGLAALGFVLATTVVMIEWRRARPRLSVVQAADVLADSRPADRDLLLTGTDIAGWGDEGAAQRGASPELARAQVDEAAKAVGALEPKAAVPVGPARLWSAWFGAALALTVAWGVLDPGGSVRVWKALLTGGPPEPVTVGNLEVVYVPPAYTGLSEQRVEGADGTVEGYPGTRVTLRGELSRAVEEGTWEGPLGRSVPLRVADRKFSVSWILDRPGNYRLVFKQRGREVPSGFGLASISLLEDARPRVSMLLPEADVEVTSDQEVEIAFEASDDFLVERVDLVLQGEEEVRIPVSLNTAAQVEGRTRLLPLAHPELGDGAHLRVEAWDGDTVAGPKAGSSRSIYLSFLDKRRLMAEIEGLEERLLEALLAHLADHLELEIASEDALEHLRAKGRDLLRLLEQLVERVRVGADEGALGALAVLRIEEGLRAGLEPFLRGGEDRSGLVAELERDILFLDRLLQSLRMEEALSMGDELAALQRSLFDDLEAGAEPEDLLERLDQIEQLLAQMAEKLSRSASEMPDAFANADAVQNMPSSELEESLDALREALQKGDMEAAKELAENLLDTLSRWMAALEEAAQGAAQGQLDPLVQQMSEIGSEVSDLAAEQERILQETQAVGEQISERAARAIQEEMESFLERQERRLQEVENAARRMERAAPRPSGFHGAGPLGEETRRQGISALQLFETRSRVGTGVSEVRQALREDLARARDSTESLEEAVESLREQVLEALGPGDPRRQSIESDGALAARELQAILDDLEALSGRRLEGLTPDEMAALEDLERREAALGERAGSLAEQLEDLAGQTPLLDSGLPQRARSAQQQMGEASGKLGRGNPFAATPPETRALEELAEISRQLEGARQRMLEGMGGQGFQIVRGSRGPEGGRDVDRSHVEIPKEREARELKAFREEVLKAMGRGQYPKDYEEEVERYYERLIR